MVIAGGGSWRSSSNYCGDDQRDSNEVVVVGGVTPAIQDFFSFCEAGKLWTIL